ncbi:hypothetical protein MMC17_009820 [Xylographa soralifera]|nr:hypothetical protein [Xylographa soralifera]
MKLTSSPKNLTLRRCSDALIGSGDDAVQDVDIANEREDDGSEGMHGSLTGIGELLGGEEALVDGAAEEVANGVATCEMEELTLLSGWGSYCKGDAGKEHDGGELHVGGDFERELEEAGEVDFEVSS